MTGNHTDTRGMSTPLSHVLSVGITTILIVTLVMSATGFLDEQQERSAREEMETIGNRLAAELDKADTLGQQGDNVTMTTNHPDRVAGNTYNVRLLTNSSRNPYSSENANMSLSLTATDVNYEAVIPIHNETNLSLETVRPGRFRISSAGGNGSAQAPTRSLDLSSRVGIGQGVGSGPGVVLGSGIDQQPVARFTVKTAHPQSSKPVDFNAGGSSDPDGSIVEYRWDFDNDSSWERTGLSAVTPSHTFGTAGTHNVTLQVEDDAGSTANVTREIRVSGLEYRDDMSATNNNVTFTVQNEYSSGTVVIERLLIDSEDIPDDYVSETSSIVDCAWWGSPGEDCTYPHEIQVDNLDSPGLEGYVDWNSLDSNRLELPEDGAIVQLDGDGDESGGDVSLGPDDTARITVREFSEDASLKDFTFGIRYSVNGTYSSNVLTDTASP